MSILVTKKHSLTLAKMLMKTITLIVTLTLLLTLMLPNSASAASKEYEVYKKIKPGMTVTEAAKLIYGKTYKKHILTEQGVKTFKEEILYMNISEDYRLSYEYGFYYDKRKTDKSIVPQIYLGVYSKPKGKTLYVGHKSFIPLDPSSSRLYKNKKIKIGMSLSQLDKITYGKGLGVFNDLTYENMTFLKILDKNGRNIFPTQKSQISYVVKSYNKKKSYLVYFNYDYKKKNYYVKDIY